MSFVQSPKSKVQGPRSKTKDLRPSFVKPCRFAVRINQSIDLSDPLSTATESFVPSSRRRITP